MQRHRYVWLTISVSMVLGVVFGHSTVNAVNTTSTVRLSVSDHWLTDQYGRVRLFHGFNSVVKGTPYYDDQIMNATRLKLYQQWGFNVVRLGTMWAGAQPVKQGQFNDTYIAVLEDTVKELATYGIYVLLDMHQVCSILIIHNSHTDILSVYFLLRFSCILRLVCV